MPPPRPALACLDSVAVEEGSSSSSTHQEDPMTTTPAAERLPRQSEVDAFGITHGGKVRSANADQFLVLTLHKTSQVQATSLPAAVVGPQTSEARAWLFLVADGVGSGLGALASEAALRHIAAYVTHATRLCYQFDPNQADIFLSELQNAVTRTHRDVQEDARKLAATTMATTLTLVAFVWPRAYLVHAGDSRCYRLRDGRLQRMTRDQTVAQALVDTGALTNSKADLSPLKHVLTSAVGSEELEPQVESDLCQWQDVLLLCTDGLTKHVSDGEIESILSERGTSEATARRLVDLALDRGGDDNITVVIGQLKTQ
jgi:protein phosphatase